METVVIVGSVVVTASVVLWFIFARQHPENAAGDRDPVRNSSAEFFGDTNDRPAGPGAEADGVAAPGQPAPGPSAEAGSKVVWIEVDDQPGTRATSPPTTG
jgi:hypothetical protein